MAAWRAVMLMILLIFYDVYTEDSEPIVAVREFLKPRGIKIFHQNARGLFSNLNLLKKFLFDHKQVDFLGISETFISKEQNEKLFEIDDYTFISKPRTVGKRGGVGVYLKNGLDYERRFDLEKGSPECIWIELFFKNTTSLLIGTYYRPPNTSDYLPKDFNNAFNNTLIVAQKEQKEVLILGDFNVNYLDKNDNKELKTIINVNGFEQIVKTATRITPTTETLIDLILTNNSSNIKDTIVYPLSIGDHDIIGCNRKLNCAKYEPIFKQTRDYKNYDPLALLNDVKKIDWNPLYQLHDTDEATIFLTSTLKTAFDKHAPHTTKVIKGKPSPWLRKDLTLLMNQRDLALRKARRTKSEDDYKQYKKLRNKCNGKLKDSKRKHYREILDENKSNPKKFWDTVKKIFPTKSKSNVPFSTQKIENERTAIIFSDYFSEIITKLKSVFSLFTDHVWRPPKIRPLRTLQTFNFTYVPKIFVERELKKLKRNKATGADDLPPGMLKDCATEISKPLAYVINMSITSGEVPTLWKQAIVSPTHKSGDKKPENFRPISILPTFSKILEKAVRSQLSDFLENNNLLTDRQFGYRKTRSTKIASALLFDDIRSSIDKGELVGAVYIDLTKAFDTVGHAVLLQKLQEYGVSDIELKWFKSYLFNRNQQVRISNSLSNKQPLFTGVPQGSILGPLLFLIFFNDFPECLEKSKVIMYADDTVIYCNGKLKTQIESDLNHDLNKVSEYFENNELIANLKKGKTEAMLFGTAKRLSMIDKILNVFYRGQQINYVQEYKYLGNKVDPNLNFNKTFDTSYKTASGRLRLLQKLRPYLTADAAYSIFTMMTVPILTYRGPIKLTYTETQKRQFKSLERRAHRLTGKRIPSILNLIHAEALNLIKSSIDNETCSNLNGYFKLRKHTKTRNNGYLIETSKMKLELGKQSFKYSGAKIFNDLPFKVRKTISTENFSEAMKTHLKV